MNSLIPAHSFNAFRTYERDIAAIVANYPSASILDPAPFSPVTYSCRIRDAINGFKLNGFSSTLFTLEQLSTIFKCLKAGGTFIFTDYTNNKVLCSSKETARPSGTILALPSFTIAREYELDARDTAVLDAVLVLKNRNLYVSPLVVVNLSPSQLTTLDNLYPNVDVTRIDEGSHLLT
jgi:hypothetical protein